MRTSMLAAVVAAMTLGGHAVLAADPAPAAAPASATPNVQGFTIGVLKTVPTPYRIVPQPRGATVFDGKGGVSLIEAVPPQFKVSTIAAPPASPAVVLPDMIPHGRPAVGWWPQGIAGAGVPPVKLAWYTQPTQRYKHGVFGDQVEAGGMSVIGEDGAIVNLTLPETVVFEDVAPRLVELGGVFSILAIETDLEKGASLAVYRLEGGKLVKVAATPPVGAARQWLNPVGVGNFLGDGSQIVALVETPHVGGMLKFYRWRDNALVEIAEGGSFSNHVMGSTELALSAVVRGPDADWVVVPSRERASLHRIRLRDTLWVERATLLPSPFETAIVPLDRTRFVAGLKDGRLLSITAD